MKVFRILILLCLLILTGCATQKPAPVRPETAGPARIETSRPELGPVEIPGEDEFTFLDDYDPLERINRHIYRFNLIVDDKVLTPVVNVYKAVLPGFVRQRISNFFSNIADVPVAVNSLLQIKPKKAGKVLGRFLVNSTIGIAGLWDPATGMGLIKYHEDFGQTLGYYGIGPGPYIVLPILGPSTLRDTTGRVVDAFGETVFVGIVEIDPLTDFTLSVIDGLELRASLPFSYGDFDSPFEYELVRAFYLDVRNLLINDGIYVDPPAPGRRPPLKPVVPPPAPE